MTRNERHPHRPVAYDFASATLVGSILLTAFGLALLWLRPIPVDIYPTFAFRPEDGWFRITAFVAINACLTAVIGTGVIGAVATLARFNRKPAAVALASVAQITLLLGALMGTGGFVSTYRWVLVAVLIAGSFAQMSLLSYLWTRFGHGRRPLLVLAMLGIVVAADVFAVSFLGHFAGLYASVFAWLYLWTHALVFSFLVATRPAGGEPPQRRYHLVKFAALGCLILGAQELVGWTDGAFLHVRRVYDWRCPEAAVLFDGRRSATVEWYKTRAAVSPAKGAAVDDSLLDGVPSPTRRLNVVVFVIDALRRDHVGAFGYTNSPTPHIDALARESTRFTQAYSPSPTTGYSVVSFMSGLLPEQAVRSAGSVMFLPRALRHFGWTTGASSSFDGLWDMVPMLAGVDSRAFGFDEVTQAGRNSFAPGYDEAVTNALIRRMTAEQTAPRFEYIHLFSAHGPFRTDDPLADYDAALRRADVQFGRFIDAMRAADRLDETIVVVMGDHGEGLGEHGMFAHSQALYVEQTAVPLIVWDPGARPRMVDTPLTLNHLPALLMNALGSKWPIETQPTLGEVTLNQEAAVQEFHIRSELVWRSIRLPPWSYHRRKLDGRTELYDLTTDPGEARDVARDNPEVVQRFERLEVELDQ